MAVRHDDADLAAVREAVADRVADRELSVARSWGTIVARRAGVEQPPGRPRRFRALVPAAAAATVAVVALGTVTLLGPRWDGLGFLGADPGTPSDTESYRPNLDPPSEQAVAWLHELAAAAEPGEPVRIEPGQLVYVRSEGWATSYGAVMPELGGVPVPAPRGTQSATPPPLEVPIPVEPGVGMIQPQPREIWFHPDGMSPLLIKAGPHTLSESSGRPLPSSGPPGPYAPTPQWLAGLPTDPDQLRADLRTWLKDDQTWSTDHAVWNAMSELYASCEILVPPQVRAALLRAFTELRGLTAVETEIDGRRLVGIRHLERNDGPEILFDPETGRAVGRRSVSTDDDLKLVVPTHGLDDPDRVQAFADRGITYQSLWTQRIVDEVGDTG